LTAWAHESEWINLTIANCEEFTDASTKIERMKDGLYLQEDLAKRILDDLSIQNEQFFHEFDVDMSRYGLYNITGVRDGDEEPCPRTWDPLRQCWSDDWKNFLYEHEVKTLEQRYSDIDYRISDKCSDPVKLMDIVNAAKKDEILCTNAIAEILE